MRIVCPSCSAAYDVPDSLLVAGRPVRCVRCSGEWAPVTEPAPAIEAQIPKPALPEAESPAPLAAAVLAPAVLAPIEPAVTPPAPVVIAGQSAMERLAASPARPKSSLPLLLAWGLTAVVIAAAVWLAYEWRGQIIAAWPPSARAYEVFGLK